MREILKPVHEIMLRNKKHYLILAKRKGKYLITYNIDKFHVQTLKIYKDYNIVPQRIHAGLPTNAIQFCVQLFLRKYHTVVC